MDDRLSDDKWRELLDNNSAPPLPTWTASFLVDEVEYHSLSRAILSFQNSVTSAFWFRQIEYMPEFGIGFEQLKAEIERLNSNNQYIGHQLLGTHFLSYDLQSPSIAIVTGDETWMDTLYATSEYSPDYGDAILSYRGPYVLSATYTLELSDDGYGPIWKVSGVVYADEPPPFE
jgi:hypothetical protein